MKNTLYFVMVLGALIAFDHYKVMSHERSSTIIIFAFMWFSTLNWMDSKMRRN